jgi:hypothetical protein
MRNNLFGSVFDHDPKKELWNLIDDLHDEARFMRDTASHLETLLVELFPMKENSIS